MHIITKGPIKPLTEVETAFAKAKLNRLDHHPKTPSTTDIGGNHYDSLHAAVVASAQYIRQNLITQVESHTGKPLAQYAQEIRNWHLSNYTVPFPSTACLTLNPNHSKVQPTGDTL